MMPTRGRSSAATASPSGQALEVPGVADFWGRVIAAPHVVLLLDYDGTLAPFHVDRMQARPLPQVLDAMQRINHDEQATVVIVSGRPVGEIHALLGVTNITIVGSHGYEVCSAGSKPREIPVSDEQRALLDTAHDQVTRIFTPERIERKVASVAVHFRGLEPQQYGDIAAELAVKWQTPEATAITELRAFNGGLELRAIGRSKGTAVREILAEAPPEALAIYIGDDETDEDAFAALPPGGIGIKVGAPDVATLAEGRLTDCAAVERLLIEWGNRRTGT